MAKFDVDVSPGVTYEVDAPDEATAWKWARAEHVKSLGKEGVTKQAAPIGFTPSGERNEPPPPTGMESLGRGLSDISQGVTQDALMLKDMTLGGKAAEVYTKDKTEEQQLYDKSRGPDAGFDPARFAGNLVATAPAAAMPGGAASSLLKRSVSSAAGGGAAAAAVFTPEGGSKLEQTVLGATLGLAVPPTIALGSKVAKTGYHGFVEPSFERGQRAIKGRAYSEAAGDKADEIVELLTRNKQLIPGSAPTAGEAAVPAGRAEFSALQESAAKIKPSEYLARSDSQNAARQEAIAEFAGNPAKLAEAEATRSSASGLKYSLGSAQLTNDLSGLDILRKRPSVEAAIRRAERGAAEQSRPFSVLGDSSILSPSQQRGLTGQDAQRIKLAFDDEIKLFPKAGVESAELRDMKASRAAYIDWMEKQFPDLAAGRAAFKEQSGPINEMETGRALAEKLTPALREDAKPRSGQLAGAIRDSAATIKKATGEPRFQELEDVLSRRSLQATHGVQDDLARADRQVEMARRGSQAAPNAVDLATSNLQRETGGRMPNLLHRGVMIANAIVARMEGKVNRKLAAEIATEMLDPPKVGEALAAAKAREARNSAVADAIVKAQRLIIPGGAAATAYQGE